MIRFGYDQFDNDTWEIINPNGLIICEHPATYSINDQYNILKIKTMGNTSLTLIKPI